MTIQCTVCGGDAVRLVSVPSLKFQFCHDCMHASTPPSISSEKVEQYYREKSKWLRFRQEHTDDPSRIPKMGNMYVRRKQFTLECLRDLERDAASQSLLDVGTASGFFLRELGTAFADKLGSDLDQAAIQYAANVLHQPAVAGDLSEPQFQDRAPFNVTCCFHVLEHVTDPVAMLRKIASLTSSDGLVVIAMPVVGESSKTISFYREFPNGQESMDLWNEHIQHFTVSSAERLAARAGLTVFRKLVWFYKGNQNLPEVLMCLQKTGGGEEASVQHASRWSSWRMRRRLVQWAIASRWREVFSNAA